MRGLKTLLGTTALLAGLAMAPAAQAQVVINIGVQPVCSYGYYGYAPYACAPMGYYGPGYFYNGIFLGMGPWGGWGYSHGWGNHRFVSEGGGRYHGGPGRVSYHSSGGEARGGGQAHGGGEVHGNAAGPHSGGAKPSGGHATVAHTSATHSTHATASHAEPSHPAPRNGGSHGGGDGKH
jgi:hypothetical protein